jgi:Soluble lytic murein transglycosylase and related regulatory proteins (some contain LysM/invasin domains)
MPLGTSMSTIRRRKRSSTASFQRAVTLAFKFILSPLVILADSFRRKGTLDKTWLFSFFLFITVLMGLTGIGILVTEGPMLKTMKMMTAVTENQEILSGDLQPIIRLINKYAMENNVDPNLVFAIIKSESNFNPMAKSGKGARGLMQIMPEIWQVYRKSSLCSGRHNNNIVCHPGECIFSPEANIRAGVMYLKDLLKHYQGRVDLALEAYNAGISNVRPGSEPKFKETRGYVQKTISLWQNLRRQAVGQELELSLYLQHGLKYLFGISFLCWLILFWWAHFRWFKR